MSFLDVRNKALIVGDAFQTRGGMAVSGQMKFWFPFPAMATWSKEISLQSAEKLSEYEPSLLAAGHGKMIKNPDTVIKLAIKEAKRNIESKKEGNLCHRESDLHYKNCRNSGRNCRYKWNTRSNVSFISAKVRDTFALTI